MPNIICGAQPNGLGPVSKLVSISMNLSGDNKLYFFGSSISLEYVKKHKQYFAGIYDTEVVGYEFKKYLNKIDGALIVMDHNLAHICHTKSIRYYFVDSLFGFWNYNVTDKVLFAKIKELGFDIHTQGTFDSFSIHEKKIIAHVFSEHSYIQAFLGIHKRKKLFEQYFGEKITIVRPIIGMGIDPSKTSKKKLVFNLGGVKNFLHTDLQKNEYVELVETLIYKMIKEGIFDLDEVYICSGFYKEERRVLLNGIEIIHVFYEKGMFTDLIYDSYIYITSPGLTNFFELITTNKKMFFFLEQHMSQYYNLEKIRTTFLRNSSLSLHDIYDNIVIPQDDFIGSGVINDLITTINNDKDLFNKTYNLLCTKIKETLLYDNDLWKKKLDLLRSEFNEYKDVFQQIEKDLKNL